MLLLNAPIQRSGIRQIAGSAFSFLTGEVVYLTTDDPVLATLQVQQGGINVDKALVESRPSLTRALMERRFRSFVHTIFHFN
jgi:hypothetical protein